LAGRSAGSLQGLLGPLTFENVLCQLLVDGHQLAGPFYDTSFEFIVPPVITPVVTRPKSPVIGKY
jgi:hypothetical protein